jgi:hypothetical protein
MPKNIIVAFGGQPGSGKSTIATELYYLYNRDYRKLKEKPACAMLYAFAKELKDKCAMLFDVDPNMFYDSDYKDTEYLIENSTLTPRQVLTKTADFLKEIDPLIFIRTICQKIKFAIGESNLCQTVERYNPESFDYYPRIGVPSIISFIEDCRYEEEFNALAQLGYPIYMFYLSRKGEQNSVPEHSSNQHGWVLKEPYNPIIVNSSYWNSLSVSQKLMRKVFVISNQKHDSVDQTRNEVKEVIDMILEEVSVR